MTFVQTLNENVLLTICFMVSILIVGLRLGYTRGGWNKNLVYLWTLFIYSIYTLISPIFFYLSGFKIIIGTDISQYYGLGFAFNTLALFCFVLGYWIKRGSKPDFWNKEPKY